MAGSKTERLREAVTRAKDEPSRLAAMAALARHFAEVSDGVNGLAVAREARALALTLGDWATASHALNSASLSQYHRSDYAGAMATAMDAWDAARRAGSKRDIADSFFSVGLALHALGEDAMGLTVADRGLAIASTEPGLEAPEVQLVGLKALLLFRGGTLEEVEAHCARHVQLARRVSSHLVELGHGNWGLALLRTAERRLESGQPVGDMLRRSREHLEEALSVATQEDDVMRIADRLSGLGQVAFLEGRLDDAEMLLSDALQRSLVLDYVRTVVMSARYLGRLNLARGEVARAIEVLRVADDKARLGVPGNIRPAMKLLLAEALERDGRALESARMREAARELKSADDSDHAFAAAEARKLAARILAEIPGPA